MLVIKRSAGVALEMNLRNPSHVGQEARKQGIHPGFGNQGRGQQKYETGVSVAPEKGLMSSKKNSAFSKDHIVLQLNDK